MVIFAIVASCGIVAMLLVVLVRQSGWSRRSIYQGLLAAGLLTNVLCVLTWNPVVLARRMVFHRGTRAWDRIWLIVFLIVLVSVVLVAVQDLTARYSEQLPRIAWLFGLVATSAWDGHMDLGDGYEPLLRKIVRIQTDHGHRVIARGPYAYIRHPGLW